jgi:hypothetical protein
MPSQQPAFGHQVSILRHFLELWEINKLSKKDSELILLVFKKKKKKRKSLALNKDVGLYCARN